MLFKKSHQKWTIQTINWDGMNQVRVPQNIIRILWVTSLLESRSDMYADYISTCLN
jgi:hypothetical protein